MVASLRVVIIVSFLSFCATAQQPVFRNFNVKNSLLSNEVYFLLQDSKHRIWICTDAGLVRYNANSFKYFTSAQGLPDNTVFEIKEDKVGRIWFRSFSNKIGYIYNDSIVNLPGQERIADFVQGGRTCSFAFDDSLNLILGKSGTSPISFLKIPPPYNASGAKEIWKDRDAHVGSSIVLIGSNDFVYSERNIVSKEFRIQVFSGQLKQVISDVHSKEDGYLFTRVSRHRQIITFLCNRSLRLIDCKNKSIIRKQFKTPLVTAVTTRDGQFAIGSQKEGLGIYAEDLKGPLHPVNLQGLTFTHLIRDYQGGEWYATLEAGVFYCPPHSIHYVDMGKPIASCALLSDSSILAAFNDGSICRVSVQSSKNTVVDTISPHARLSPVKNAITLRDGKVLLTGTFDSYLYDGNKNRIKKVLQITLGPQKGTMYIKDLVFFRDSLVMVGLNRFFLATEVPLNVWPDSLFSIPDRLSCVDVQPNQNTVFMGGLKGLYRFSFPELSSPQRILTCRVEDLMVAHDTLYIATNANGVIVKTETGQDTIDERTGMLSNICKAIMFQNNVLWVTTVKGMSKISIKKSGYDVVNYPLNAFPDAGTLNKTMVLSEYAATWSGNKLYYFERNKDSSPDEFHIQGILVNGESIRLENNLFLDYQHSTISFTYEALLYNAGTGIIYRYKTNSADDWKYTHETSVNFENLKPGSYTLIVQAKNISGKWISSAEQINFTIDRPFWQKNWFIFSAALVIILLTYLVIRRRYSIIMAAKDEKNRNIINMVELENKAIRAQMNPHFIFNCLNSIHRFILEEDHQSAALYLTQFSKLLRDILETSTSDSIALPDEIMILAKYLEIEKLRFQSAFTYKIENEVSPGDFVRIPFMMVQPFVENSIWHGLLPMKAGGEISIRFVRKDNSIICTVEDNGVGRSNAPKTHGKTSLAIDLVRQRLALYEKIFHEKYSLKITDKKNNFENTGTVVEISMPILT